MGLIVIPRKAYGLDGYGCLLAWLLILLDFFFFSMTVVGL